MELKRKAVARFLLTMLTVGGIILCNVMAYPATPVQAAQAETGEAVNTATSLAAGAYHTLLVRSDGTLWAWGLNDRGQLGLGDNADRNVPTQVGSHTNWVAVSAGGHHSLGLRSDGTLWAWGLASNGQLGLDYASDYESSPTQVGMDTNWLAVSTGEYHSLGLRSDGTLWAWGYNGYGQLGIHSITDASHPQRVGNANSWVSVSAGRHHSLGLRSDGTLYAWGDNDRGQLGLGDALHIVDPTRVGMSTWVAVSAGGEHSMGLHSDGTVWAWGSNNNGQLGLGDTDSNIPAPAGGLNIRTWVAVSAGGEHSMGLRSDGTLWAWGSNNNGQLGLGDTDSNIPTPVGGLNIRTWVAVSAGEYHSLGLRSDGTLWAWGDNTYGQLGLPDITNIDVPTRVNLTLASPPLVNTAIVTSVWDTTATLNGEVNPPGKPDFVAVSAGLHHSLGLRSDGTLWAWGDNTYGQLGLAGTNDRNVPTRVGDDTDWVAVSAGEYHSLGLRSDGTLYAWGHNTYGQLGLIDLTNRFSPTRVGSDTDWVAVSAGGYHSLGLRSDGTLWAWGHNEYGQLGQGDNYNASNTERVGDDTDWVAVSAGGYHSLGLRSDGTLWAWGWHNRGQLGVGIAFNWGSPTRVGGGTDWVAVSAGQFHTLGLRSDGTLWAWGDNNWGQLGQGDTNNTLSPTPVGSDTSWVAVSAGGAHSLGLRSNGTLWAWGDNTYGQLGRGDTTDRFSPTPVGGVVSWVAVCAGQHHSLGLRSDGTLWAWGYNDGGQLGLADVTHRNVPTQVGSDTSWVAVSAGGWHSLGLRSDGTLWAWGWNDGGQLGLGDTTRRNVPTQVGSDTDWVTVSAGMHHSLGLRSDGTLWTWGENMYGQLGQGDTTNLLRPTQVGSDTDWVTVSAGSAHSLGLRSDGALWAWGWNDDGQLGQGNTTNLLRPTQVGSDTDWVAVSAGGHHSLGLRSDGTLWAWGDNWRGQLGQGNISPRLRPTQEVGSDTDWVAVSAGQYFSLGLRSDGTLWAWGDNRWGQLGQGHTNDTLSPTQVGMVAIWRWVAVSAGQHHSLGLRSDGTLWAWGNNDDGQLGQGDTTDLLRPAQVGSDTDWVAVSAGGWHSLGLPSDGTLWAWGDNGGCQLGHGDTTDLMRPDQVVCTVLSCQVSFEWGPTTSYGHETTPKTMAGRGEFSDSITSLTPGTTYHFRAKGATDYETIYGDDVTFTTALDSYTEAVSDGGVVDAKGVADTEVEADGTATVTVASFADNPAGAAPTGFEALDKYIDVYVPDTSQVGEIEIRLYYTDAELAAAGIDEELLELLWWDGSDWTQCSDSGVNTATTNGYSGYIWARITDNTTPSLADLEGTAFGAYQHATETPGGFCFIATAAYGTPTAEEIQILREFRDEYLLPNPVGQALVGLYYEVSPPMAEFINEHPGLKPVVRAGLLPAVAISAVAVNPSPAEKTAIVGFLVLVSVALALWANRRRSRGTQYA